MKKALTILFLAIFHSILLFAQQPPAQLPSLLEDSYTRTPILHNNENAETIIRKSIFVKAVANAQSVYIGQPFLVTYKLYSCIFCKSRVNKQPTFNSCSITELGYPLDPQVEIINGKQFHVFTIRKVQVTPLEEGVLRLGTVEVENLVPFVHDDNAEDNFTFNASNDPLEVQVKALPEKNKPSDFSNIVGSFTMSATIDTNNVPVGENATLNITIKGNGNFTGIHLPEIHWPHGTEHFDASDTQHIDDNAYPVIGYKKFSVPFIGSKMGHAEIGPVSFNYFDPADASYKTITVDKLPVEFSKAVNNTESLANIVQEDVTNRKYLWIVGAIAATVIITLLIGAKVKSNKVVAPRMEENSTPKQEVPQQDNGAEILSALNRLGYVDDDKKFLSAASYLLVASLQIKLGAPENTTTDDLLELLRNSESHDLFKMCKQIFDDCNRNLYTPDAEEGIKEKIYFELSAVIKKLYSVT